MEPEDARAPSGTVAANQPFDQTITGRVSSGGASSGISGSDSENIKISDKDIAIAIAPPEAVAKYIVNTLKPIYKTIYYNISENKEIQGGYVTSLMLFGPMKDGKEDSTRVFLWTDASGNAQHFISSDSLIRFLASRESNRYENLAKFFGFEVISGLLAITLLVAVIASAFVQSGHVDPILGSALSLVIGFYFGRETKSK